MFRRKRSSSAPRPVSAPSASAQLAASQAFLANQTSNVNLSNAAAAAALRSMTPTPTHVGDAPTKRRIQRQSSVSSNGSAGSRGLQRRDSGASMTERTFRTPSPNRPASRDKSDAPPVPPLPKNYTNRRAASMEPPMRVTSPTPKTPGGRGASLDRGPAPKQKQTPNLKQLQEASRAESRNSINFSYPTNARPNSPPANSTPPKSITSNNAAAKYAVTEASTRPVKKKKKKVAPGSAEGSHLASGGMGGKPLGTEIDQNVTKPKPASTDSESDSTPEKAERKAQRASGQLNKQPSIVREDWEGEQAADESLSPVNTPAPPIRSRKQAPNISRKVEVIPTITEQPLEQPPNEHLQIKTQEPKPRTSISPSRSTRFSAQLSSELLGERKHEPPPRSLSPAKPALKHHSPSRTHSPIDGNMPGGWRRSSQTPSEASETTSLASAEGSKKRRAMHVSFNAEPSIVAEDETKLRSNHLDTIEAEDDMEEVMKPRPALPSFGSIRNKKAPEIRPSSSGKASVSSSASSSESYLPPTMETSVSSDHAIGAVLAQNNPRKSEQPEVAAIDPNLPLPPEVTTVEGTGYASDTEGSTYSNESFTLGESHPKSQPSPLSTIEIPSGEAPPEAPTEVKAKPLTIDTEADLPVKRIPEEVPKIAVQPATPGIDTEQTRDEWLVDVPGGFPETREPSENGSISNDPKIDVATTSPADVGIAEPIPTEAVAAQSSTTPAVGSISKSLLDQPTAESDAESMTGDSIYSDAAEDVADLEGDGFGSINAIVESPVTKPPQTSFPSPPNSPIHSSPTQSSPKPKESWDQTQAHWTELAQRQRQTVTSPPPEPEQPVTQTKPKKKKKKPVSAPVASKPIEIEGSDVDSPIRAYPLSSPYPMIDSSPRDDPGPSKQSMRSPPPEADEGSHLRQAIRPPPKSALRQSNATKPPKSVPKSEPRGALQKKSIPASVPSGGKPATAGASKASKPTPKPKPKRQPQPQPIINDSDSESSFKRERRSKASDKYTMRRSMRSPAPESARSQSAVAPLARPTSPTTRRPFSAGGQGALRSTMRSSDSGTPSLRGPRQRPASISSFSRSPKLSNTPTPSAALTSRFKSRFASDSDDEDVPRVFASRFEDSSDDEPEPLNLRPVRGIPRKTDEEDSTDLNDSSEEETTVKQSKVQIASPKSGEPEVQDVQRMGSSSGNDLTKSIDFSPTKKKGLFGRFRSKKAKEDTSRVSKSTAESPARRDTHLERSRAELKNTRNESSEPKGKLQRRTMPARVASGSWPLPEKANDADRPNTSDGLVNDMNQQPSNSVDIRPTLGARENTASTLRSEGGTPIYGRSGKKKRFPMLRKAFGLHD